MEKEEGETEYEVMEKIDKEKQKIEKWKKIRELRYNR